MMMGCRLRENQRPATRDSNRSGVRFVGSGFQGSGFKVQRFKGSGVRGSGFRGSGFRVQEIMVNN